MGIARKKTVDDLTARTWCSEHKGPDPPPGLEPVVDDTFSTQETCVAITLSNAFAIQIIVCLKGRLRRLWSP